MAAYSMQEAEANFQEILDQVRGGERVVIVDQGENVAEIRPLLKKANADSVEETLRELEEQGIISPATERLGEVTPIPVKPGALARFLESRR